MRMRNYFMVAPHLASERIARETVYSSGERGKPVDPTLGLFSNCRGDGRGMRPSAPMARASHPTYTRVGGHRGHAFPQTNARWCRHYAKSKPEELAVIGVRAGHQPSRAAAKRRSLLPDRCSSGFRLHLTVHFVHVFLLSHPMMRTIPDPCLNPHRHGHVAANLPSQICSS